MSQNSSRLDNNKAYSKATFYGNSFKKEDVAEYKQCNSNPVKDNQGNVVENLVTSPAS